MVLTYKFKKEKLKSGLYVQRPRILVEIKGLLVSIVVPALIDSGCDITVIPESVAKSLGLSLDGEKDKLVAFRESNDVIRSTAIITFIGRLRRDSVTLSKVPILIVLSKKGYEEEQDIVLGIEGIFDNFDITFRKSENRIIMKKVVKPKGFYP